jgi:hypothetical protein
LSAAYYGSSPTAPPYRLEIGFSAYATEPLYRQHSQSRLIGLADGEKVPLGLGIYDPGYSQMVMSNGKEVTRSVHEGIGARNLPDGTNIGRTHQAKDLSLEMLVVESASLDGLLKLAQAHHAEMQLGPTKFELLSTELEALRCFIKAITPPGYKPNISFNPNIAIAADVPSEVNGAALNPTMDWLRARLLSLRIKSGQARAPEIDSKALSKCQFSYTQFLGAFMSTGTPGPVSNTLVTQRKDFVVDFVDLDPDATEVFETPFEMILRYATNDSQLKIKSESYEDESRYRGSTIYLFHSNEIHLKKDGKPAELRAAFVHAIRVCKNQPQK